MKYDNQIFVEIDKAQLARIQSLFANYPKSIGKIFKESINAVATKARTDLVGAGTKLTKINKSTLRRFTSIKKATNTKWSAYVRAWSRKIPIRYLNIQPSETTTKIIEATPKQSLWLYKNVFLPKYGKDARFSLKYKLKRRVNENITYKVGREVRTAPQGAFFATMKTGYTGVFTARKDVKGAIREVVGPSLGEVLNANKIEVTTIQNNAMKGLKADIDARIGRYIKMRDTGTLPGYKTA